MKKFFWIVSILLTITMSAAAEKVTSPNGNLVVDVVTNPEGHVIYTLTYKGVPVISPSKMGFDMEEADLTKGFKIVDVKRSTFDETWTPVWGQYSNIRNHYNELDLLVEQPSTGNSMWIEFRVYNDGIGFRYVLP